MRSLVIPVAAAFLATSLAAVPDFADAKAKKRTAHASCVRHKSNNGTAIGAVGGGVLGNVIAGSGSRTTGTLVGAGVGAVAGHQIAKSKAKRRC